MNGSTISYLGMMIVILPISFSIGYQRGFKYVPIFIIVGMGVITIGSCISAYEKDKNKDYNVDGRKVFVSR